MPFVECLSWDEYAASLLNQGTGVDMVDQIQETCDLRAYPALPLVQTPMVKDVVCLEHLGWDMVATLLRANH